MSIAQQALSRLGRRETRKKEVKGDNPSAAERASEWRPVLRITLRKGQQLKALMQKEATWTTEGFGIKGRRQSIRELIRTRICPTPTLKAHLIEGQRKGGHLSA